MTPTEKPWEIKTLPFFFFFFFPLVIRFFFLRSTGRLYSSPEGGGAGLFFFIAHENRFLFPFPALQISLKKGPAEPPLTYGSFVPRYIALRYPSLSLSLSFHRLDSRDKPLGWLSSDFFETNLLRLFFLVPKFWSSRNLSLFIIFFEIPSRLFSSPPS